MKDFPPPVLVDTWIFVVTTRNFNLEHVQLPIRRVLKHYFGTIDLARLYVEQSREEDIEIHFI